MINWTETYAAIWNSKKEYLKPVKYLDVVNLDNLIKIELQKDKLLKNTQKFINNSPFNHALLWGSRGTGKSSLIKAVFNELKSQDLRLIEIDKEDLNDLPLLSDYLRELPFKFIIFCDDLSFEDGESGYRGLKRILEGSIEKNPENIVLYATSNRRHLVPEYFSDNYGTHVGNEGEINYSDSVEEKISLSDRFGLLLSFPQGIQKDYLELIDFYFKDYHGDRKEVHKEALRFAQIKTSKSARTAKQFFNYYTT